MHNLKKYEKVALKIRIKNYIKKCHENGYILKIWRSVYGLVLLNTATTSHRWRFQITFKRTKII